MNNHVYIPTKIIHEQHAVQRYRQLLLPYGTRAFIVTGKHSSKHNNSLNDLIIALRQNNQFFSIYSNAICNPNLDCVYIGSQLARNFRAEFIIGIGGGSAMDTAKIISLLASQTIHPNNLFNTNFNSQILPLVMIPTTAGSGSEVTPYAVLTNDIEKTKKTLTHQAFFPQLSLLDARYTMHLPFEVTIDGIFDALSHSIEGILSTKATPSSNLLAQESISIISSTFSVLSDIPIPFEVRDKLLYASSLAGMVIAQTGTNVIHTMGYPLTYFHNIAHGRANGLLLFNFLKFINRKNNEKVAKILDSMNFKNIIQFETALKTFIYQDDLFSKNEISNYVPLVMSSPKIHDCIASLTQEEIFHIYCASLIIE